MAEKTRVFLAADSRDAVNAEKLGLPCVYLFYRIGDNGALQRAQLPVTARGGMLGVFEAPGLSDADPEKLAKELGAECMRRGYAGIMLDLQAGAGILTPLSVLSQALRKLGIVHYVPAELAAAAPGAKLIVSTAVSGGSFSQLLDEACARWGADNICLDIARTRSAFEMPGWSPEGRALAKDEFAKLLEQHSPSVFFSPELCAKYFTCREGGKAQFILFDDADTAAYKVDLARRRGLPAVFLLYSEWGALAREIVK